jgi:hypothetical protein
VHTLNPRYLPTLQIFSSQDVNPVSHNRLVPIQDDNERYILTEAVTDHLNRNAVASIPTAQIIVGSGANAKSFHVHKKLLCDSSTYFNAALNNGFMETKTQVIELDDEEHAVILSFILWLYDDKLNKKTLPAEYAGGALEKHLFKLYVFADKRGIPSLANDVITMLAGHCVEEPFTLSEIVWAVRLISRKSKLYDLFLDILVTELRNDLPESLDNQRTDVLKLPKECLFDLLLRTNELSDQFCERYQCFEAVCDRYHCHDGHGTADEEDCSRNIEAGWNLYNEVEDVEQCNWSWDA